MYLESVTIKVDEELKRRMEGIDENWSAYLRDAIRERVEREERKKAAAALAANLRSGKFKVPSGFVNSVIREMRDSS
jgi:predicted transcriptional regulator